MNKETDDTLGSLGLGPSRRKNCDTATAPWGESVGRYTTSLGNMLRQHQVPEHFPHLVVMELRRRESRVFTQMTQRQNFGVGLFLTLSIRHQYARVKIFDASVKNSDAALPV